MTTIANITEIKNNFGKFGENPSEIDNQQGKTSKELCPILKKHGELRKEYVELQKKFAELGHREGEEFNFNDGTIKKDPNNDNYIHFMGSNYRQTGDKGKLYEVRKDDNGKGYIYIGGTNPLNDEHWSGNSFILRSDGFIYKGTHEPIIGGNRNGNGTRFAPNGDIYEGDISIGEPINPTEEDTTVGRLKGSYFDKSCIDEIGKKTTIEIISVLTAESDNYLYNEDDELNNELNDELNNELNNELNRKKENKGKNKNQIPNNIKTAKIQKMPGRGRTTIIKVEETGKSTKYSFSSWGENIEFEEGKDNYIFNTKTSNGEAHTISFPTQKGENFIQKIADLINRATYISKSEKKFASFENDNNNLLIHYKSSFIKDKILLMNIPKLGITAEEFTSRLNEYINENKAVNNQNYNNENNDDFAEEKKRGRPHKF